MLTLSGIDPNNVLRKGFKIGAPKSDGKTTIIYSARAEVDTELLREYLS